MKVLWFSNLTLSEADPASTGTWLGAMARGLVDSGAVELGVISGGPVSKVQRSDACGVSQWIVPEYAVGRRSGLPSRPAVADIVAACAEFAPDVVHVWGTEGYWGLLTARGHIRAPALLEMQGLKQSMVGVYDGGLGWLDRMRCVGIKEMITGQTLARERRTFARWGHREEEMIRGHRFIDVQSRWTAAQVRAIQPGAELFEADRMLRTSIEEAAPWQPARQMAVFTSSAYSVPFKGLHVAIRAVAALRTRCPGVRLRIAGAHQRSGLRTGGYVRWLNALIGDLHMEDCVDWLGALSGTEIVRELQAAGAALIPSFVESYCVAMAESMWVGVPTVAAFNGGIAHLGRDSRTCLLFPRGDVAMCAQQLERVLTDAPLAAGLARQARAAALARHDRATLVARQITTYRHVLAQSDPDGGGQP